MWGISAHNLNNTLHFLNYSFIHLHSRKKPSVVEGLTALLIDSFSQFSPHLSLFLRTSFLKNLKAHRNYFLKTLFFILNSSLCWCQPVFLLSSLFCLSRLSLSLSLSTYMLLHMFLKFLSPYLAAESEPIVVKGLGRVLPDSKCNGFTTP